MGIYSKIKEKSITENYIEDNFLESCLSEEGIQLHKKAISFKNEDNNWNNLCEMFEEISNSSLSDYSKFKIIEETVQSMKRETVEEQYGGLISESVLLEYQGNPEKNKEFIDCLKDLEELIQFFMDNINKLSDGLNKLTSISEEIIKSPKKYKEKLEQCRTVVKEYNIWYEKAHKKINGQVTWRQFFSKIKKFNNKYSQVAMEEKKKLDSKLDMLDKEIRKVVSPWAKDGDKIKKLVNNVEKLYELDKDYTKTFEQICSNFSNVLISEANDTVNDIYTTRKDLGIEKEKGFMYKAINKLLK